MAATATYTFTDPLDLPRITLQQLHEATADGILLESGEASRSFWRYAPEHHDDPDNAHLFPGFADHAISYPPAFLTAATYGRLTGYRTTLSHDRRCFTDESLPPQARAGYQTRLATKDPFANEETQLRPTSEPGQLRLETTNKPKHRLRGSVVVLCSTEPYNFGSFLFRVLPKLHAIRRYGLAHLPVLAHAPARTQQQYLALAGLTPDHLIQHDPRALYTIDHAIRPCLRNNHAFLDHESRALFANLRDRHGKPGANKIYVSRLRHSRTGASTRRMTNELELIARLSAQGFQIIEPETLTALEQIEVFSAADLIVGPSGAGLFNAVFCRPGTRIIDLESEPHWIHAHTCLFASCGLRYAIFEGSVDPTDPHEVHRAWSVNINALCDRIAAFTPTDSPTAQASRRPPIHRSGTLDQITKTQADGWARDEFSPTPPEIEILINNVPAGRIIADRPREDLRAQGPCAFTYTFPTPLPPNATVAARFADTGADLVHSPRRLGIS